MVYFFSLRARSSTTEVDPKKALTVDYLIQMKYGTLYVCEIKFSKNKIDLSIVSEVQKKIDALKYPKGYSCRPVLIHVNGVMDEVIDSEYFATIIDISTIFEIER